MPDHEAAEVVNTLSGLCAEMKVKTLIQVGAGDGYEAFTIAGLMGCRAIAIEGDTRCTPCSPWLEFHHMLIGATDCTMPFYLHNSMCLSSQITRGGKEIRIETEQQRLDTFCSRRANLIPDGLIIDTEGTTMDVLEGCEDLLRHLKIVYAEIQTQEIRPGIRLVGEVNELLTGAGMIKHEALPSYDGGAQGNLTWIRK